MFKEMLFDKTTIPVINSTLDSAMLRSRVIANNIANVNTPGFRRVEVSFEKELKNALDKGNLKGYTDNDKHLKLGRPDASEVTAKAYKPTDATLASGVNNVDIDTEMAKLAETQIAYNYGIKFGQQAFKKLNSAIQARSIPV